MYAAWSENVCMYGCALHPWGERDTGVPEAPRIMLVVCMRFGGVQY